MVWPIFHAQHFINQGDENHPSDFRHNHSIGNAIRRASGRLLVTQSAGNFNRNACLSAFNYSSIGGAAKDNDGVIVVGGTDPFGNRYPATPNPFPYATEDRSNFGPCIEAWAPGQYMTTTISNGSLVSATGTSFAAPIVAALAGRYGSIATRPVEREKYIKNSLFLNGKYEEASTSNLPIKLARYTSPSSHNIPKRLPIAAVYSKTSAINLNKLIDEKFYDGINWNAGSQAGSIVLDLGVIKNIKGIRVMIRSSANGGGLSFTVHGGNSIDIIAPGVATIPLNPITHKDTVDQFDLVPYYIPLDGRCRYLMLNGNNTSSWLSYSEVEVYGF